MNKVGDICILEHGKIAKIIKIGDPHVDDLWDEDRNDYVSTHYFDYVVETIEAWPKAFIVKSYEFVEAQASEIAKVRLMNRE